MTPPNGRSFTIVGAGLGGALLANYLAQAGHDVELYERRPDPRAAGYQGGRSINLAISERGLNALRGVGLDRQVLAMAVPMPGRMIHARDGSLRYQPYDRDPTRCIHSLSRGGLNLALIEAAGRHERVRMFFEHKCTDADLDSGVARFEDARTGRIVQSSGDAVIAVDGAFSAVRRAMLRLDRFDYSQHHLAHGYKELHIPPADDGGFRMRRDALHIWPRRSFMTIALPNPDGSYTVTCFWPLEGEDSFASLRCDDDVLQFFHREFPDAVPLLPTLLEDFRRNPVGSLMTVRCGPWNYRDKVLLMGDAAHAIVPFYGQGANAAFEDCVALSECLKRHNADVGAAFAELYAIRKPNAEAIADLALQNFIEMRDKSGSAVFRAYKQMERTLHGLAPQWYTPLYTMVSFSTIPYAEARRRARLQDRVVFGLMALATLLDVVVLVAAALGLWSWLA